MLAKIKKQKALKSIIKRKLENCKNCLAVTTLENKITYLEKIKLT